MNKQELTVIFPRTFWLAEEEVPWLHRTAGDTSGPIVEIGAAYGGSATLFLRGKRPGVHVYSIDPFVEDMHSHRRASEHECRAAVRQAVGDELYQDWTLIPEYSHDVAQYWSLPIGLLYIDGDHSYEGVRQDFEDWAPFVRDNGMILFHDSCRLPDADPRKFARGWQGPTRLVAEIVQAGEYAVVDRCFSITELRRA